MPRRRIRCWRIAALAMLALIAVPAGAAARPFRGAAKWSVLLCRFNDSGAPQRTAAYFRSMILTRGTGGLADYWDTVSVGGVNLAGSVVRGWYRMNVTEAQGQALDRWGRVDACRTAASTSTTAPYVVPSDHLLAIITFPSIDLFGWNGGAFLPWDVDVGAMAHETGHGLGLEHAFSDDPTYQNASWSAIGEYDDPWDVMSWGNAFRVPTAGFGDGPVPPNAFHRDRMGWLARSRILTVGADGARSRQVTNCRHRCARRIGPGIGAGAVRSGGPESLLHGGVPAPRWLERRHPSRHRPAA